MTRTPFALLAALAAVIGLGAPAQPPPPAPTVPTLVASYIERYFQTFPSLATQAGRHDLDRQLEDLSAARRAEWLRFNRDTLEQLTAAVKTGGLPLDDRLDAEALTSEGTVAAGEGLRAGSPWPTKAVSAASRAKDVRVTIRAW